MKTKLLLIVTIVTLLIIPKANFGQAPPLGSAAKFVLFSSGGAVGNTAGSGSQITGNVGTYSGAITGFGNVNGIMYPPDSTKSGICKADLQIASDQLASTIATLVLPVLLGHGDTLEAGVYAQAAATELDSILYLDAKNVSGAIFIFKIGAPLSTTMNSKVKLINGALACNVYWRVSGLVDMAEKTVMRGTVIANNAAIKMAVGDTLEGRALSTTGSVTTNGVLAYIPAGCLMPVLSGPVAPTLGVANCYALFTSDGTIANGGSTYVTGDVGSNTAAPTGYNQAFVTGKVHLTADGSTGQCAADLLTAYDYMTNLTPDIQLLYPAEFGYQLVLTPHTYIMLAAATLTDTVYLNAEGNSNAVFVIKIKGAFSTSSQSQVKLINGTQAKNVYWLVNGQTDINDSSRFNGTIICAGAMNLTKQVKLNGRALSIVGAITTADMNAVASPIPNNCSTVGITSLNMSEAVIIYPNPFTSSIDIILNDAWQINNAELSMYNALGEIVMNVSVTKQLTTIGTNLLPAGIYFYKVVGDNKTIQTGRLISQQ